MLNIRLLAENDAERLYILDKLCFSKPWTQEMFAGELKAKASVYYGAFEGDLLVGYIGMWLAAGDGSITNVAVHPEHRRRGIASALLKVLFSHKAEIYNLEVRSNNTGAIALYKTHGFTIVGTRKGYYSDNGEDAIVMIKNI